MAREYPRMGRIQKLDRPTKAKCKCGSHAKFKVHVQFNIFRGDDDVLWSCEDHKKDVDFLTATATATN